MTNSTPYELICNAFATSTVGLAIRSAHDRALYANPALEKLFGRSRAELEAVRLAEFYHPDDRERSHMLFSRLQAGEIPAYSNTVRLLHKDGRAVWVINELSALRDERGEIIHTVSLFHDISASKETEADAARKTALLQATLDTMGTAYAVYSEDMRLLRYNSMFEKLFDYPADFLYAGIPVQELFRFRARRGDYGPGEVEAIVERRFAEASFLNERSGEHRLTTGKSYIHHRKSLPGGGCVTTYVETTEQRNAEERLRQSQKMEAVGQLTGGVAHDFNNLLAVMLGNLELLREQLVLDSEARQTIETIHAAGERGARLTQQLLSFSRRQPLNPRPLDVADHVLGLTGLLRRTLGENIEIEFAADENTGLCRADDSQLDTAIINLCLNSRDAMLDGGTLRISTGRRSIAEAQAKAREEVAPGDYVTISVADSGCGMTQDVLEHATEPFFTTKDVGQGSGLGLSMVYGFARQSGGFIDIESAPGRGTTVTICLPAAESVVAASRQAQEKRETPVFAAGRAPLILVVEDDPEVRAVTLAMVARLGCRTIEAAGAEEALARLSTGAAPDLLFTDIVLPKGMNGIELARAARELNPGLRVLFTSGYPDIAERDAGADLGEILVKPYTLGALKARLHDVLRG